MQFIQLQGQNGTSIPSASSGALNVFVDQSTNTLALKDDAGTLVPVSSGGGFPFEGDAVITGSLSLVSGSVSISTPEYIANHVRFVKTPYSSSEIDVIEPGVTEIARGNNQGIYNAALEGSYSNNFSPYGTLWNSVYTDPFNYGWGNLQSVPYRTYSSWQQALNANVGNNIIELPMVMHDTNTGKYYLVKFYQWTPNNNGGGFSYDRYELILPQSSSFTKPNYSTATQDTISPGLVIARGDNKGIYNSVLEEVYDDAAYQSPLGTRWNSVYTDSANYGWANLSNVTIRTYNSWYEAVNQSAGNYVVGLEMVMHDTTEDKYYAVKFTDWTQGGNGGGFSYERTLIQPNGSITFQDGTAQSTAYDPGLIAIKLKGNTLYSSNAGTGSDYTQTNLILGPEAGSGATNIYNTNLIGFQAGFLATGPYSSNFFGYQAGSQATNANDSNFLGSQAGFLASSANNSNFLGNAAGFQATSAQFSNFFGPNAGYQATNAYRSNFLGIAAGFQATNADNSNFFGNGAGYSATNANDSNFLGSGAGYQATDANLSNFFGQYAGYQAATAVQSNFMGWYSGYRATTAADSNFFGPYAGYSASNANFSNFFGFGAGREAAEAQYSNFIGPSAGYQATYVQFSNFLGYQAGYSAASASYSNIFGYNSGKTVTGTGIGPNNIIIGTNITLENYRQNSINIGGILFGTGSYSNTAGNPYSGSAGGKIGINVPNPQQALDVSGSVAANGFMILSQVSSSLNFANDAAAQAGGVPLGGLYRNGSVIQIRTV